MKIRIVGTLEEVNSVLPRLEGIQVLVTIMNDDQQPSPVVVKKTTLSAESRKKISDAQKKRWADVRARRLEESQPSEIRQIIKNRI